MKMSLAGNIYLWVSLLSPLWPFLVVVSYYLILRPQVANAAVIGFVCIVASYSAIFLIDIFARPSIGPGVLLYLVVPAVITHALVLVVPKKIKVSN